MFKDNFIKVARAYHLALKTERSYWHCARHYIRWLGAKSAKDLEHDATENFRKYLSAMANEHPDRTEGNESVSASTQSLNFHALRFLIEKVIGVQLGDLSHIPRAKREKIILHSDTHCANNRQMKKSPIAKKLIEWRGKRGQKEVADLLDVNLRTYEGWEVGRKPSRYAINQIYRKMQEHP